MWLFIADLVTPAPCAAVRMTGRMGQYGRSAVFSIYLSTQYLRYSIYTPASHFLARLCPWQALDSRYKYLQISAAVVPSTAPATTSRAAGDFIKPNVGTFTPASPAQTRPAYTGQGTITGGFTCVVCGPYITLHRLSCVTCHVTSVWCVTCHEVTCLLTVGLVIKYRAWNIYRNVYTNYNVIRYIFNLFSRYCNQFSYFAHHLSRKVVVHLMLKQYSTMHMIWILLSVAIKTGHIRELSHSTQWCQESWWQRPVSSCC